MEMAINQHPGYGFAFPAYSASVKKYHLWTYRMPYPSYGFPHSISSEQGTHFSANEMQQWTHAHGIHWSYHVPHHPKVAGLTE